LPLRFFPKSAWAKISDSDSAAQGAWINDRVRGESDDPALRIALRGTDDEFDHLNASLNAMLDRIQELMLGLQQVSSDIAHDLRTPLTRLRQRLEMGRRRETTVDGLHNALDGAMRDADVILETFSALLRIAQIEAGSRRSGFKPVGLSELLEGLIEAYQPVAEEVSVPEKK